jgi:hypothetical protein
MTVQGNDIRLGNGSADVLATHTGNTYSTTLDVTRQLRASIVIGHTLPHGARPATVLLDGHAIHDYQVRETNRGNEVTAPAGPGRHTLTITTA